MSRLLVTLVAVLAWLAHVPARAATVDGIDIHWTSAGSGPRAVIFVHGWTCDETSWQSQVPAFSSEYRVVTLDLPGHGKSGSPRDKTLSMDLFARAVEAVRSEAGIEQAVLVGHSMGTPVVRQYALRFPQRVAGLVLVDGLVLVAGAADGFTPPPMTGAEGRTARETMVRGMFGPSATPALRAQIERMMLGTSEATAAGAMAATWDQSWWTNEQVRVPVLGVYADKSGLANREAMARLYPDLEYHEVAGTGHFVMMEKPAEFNELIGRFLARLRY